MERVSAAHLKLSSVIIYGYLAFLAALLPFILLLLGLALSGQEAVYRYGEPVYGVDAVLSATLLWLIFPFVPATGLTFGTALLRVLRARAPKLTVKDASRAV